jgi:hypothetical protein
MEASGFHLVAALVPWLAVTEQVDVKLEFDLELDLETALVTLVARSKVSLYSHGFRLLAG